MSDCGRRAIINEQIFKLVSSYIANSVTCSVPSLVDKRNLKDYANILTFTHYFLELGCEVDSFADHYTKFKDLDRDYLEEKLTWYQNRYSMNKKTADWMRKQFGKIELYPLSHADLVELEDDAIRLSK